MGRPKGSKNKSKVEEVKEVKKTRMLICKGKCGKKLSENNFYISKSPMYPDGKIPICKKCIREMIDYDDINTIYTVLQAIDIPFYYNRWQECVERGGYIMGNYIRMANSGINEFKGARWKDSIFERVKDGDEEPIEIITTNKNTQEKELKTNTFNMTITPEVLYKLKDKFGYGYPDEEYLLFEKKYSELRPSFSLPTTMHEECLREYCIDKVKESLAKAKGNFKEAKEWASMAKEQANSGKLNPSQMSKSDLTGGLDTFGQMARMVEESDKGELLELLPSFVEKPKDKVDVTLWLYINYIRDLLGKEECAYKDIWEFYNKRAEDYEKEMIDNNFDDFVKENTKEGK